MDLFGFAERAHRLGNEPQGVDRLYLVDDESRAACVRARVKDRWRSGSVIAEQASGHHLRERSARIPSEGYQHACGSLSSGHLTHT
jgi:hypothetical protein